MRPLIEVKNPGFHLGRGLGESQASIMYDPQRCEPLPLEPHCSRRPSRVGLVASDAIAPVYEVVHRVITKRCEARQVIPFGYMPSPGDLVSWKLLQIMHTKTRAEFQLTCGLAWVCWAMSMLHQAVPPCLLLMFGLDLIRLLLSVIGDVG